jgi:hypothetical protein
MTEVNYLLGIALLVITTMLRYAVTDEMLSKIRRLILAVSPRDPRRKNRDVVVMLIQCGSLVMIVTAPFFDWLQKTYKDKSVVSDMLTFLITFFPALILVGTIKFFDVVYWSKDKK